MGVLVAIFVADVVIVILGVLAYVAWKNHGDERRAEQGLPERKKDYNVVYTFRYYHDHDRDRRR